jgi:hypothetical protein
MSCSERLLELLGRLKALAGEYYELAGRALVGVADEIAQYEAAARLADVELAAARDRGYAAIRRLAWRTVARYGVAGEYRKHGRVEHIERSIIDRS